MTDIDTVRVLIIEDDAAAAKLWAMLASRRTKGPMTIEVVRTKADALERLREPWDLVVLDPGLPDTLNDPNAAIVEIYSAAAPAPVQILTAGMDPERVTDALLLVGVTHKADLSSKQDFLEQLFGPRLDDMIAEVRAVRRRVDSLSDRLHVVSNGTAT